MEEQETSLKPNSGLVSSRDPWMTESLDIANIEAFGKKRKSSFNTSNSRILEKPGQNVKELNPFWKNGGLGLPKESSETGEYLNVDVEWLKRALTRSEQRAKEENKSLESVVSERWGSLENLKSMIKRAENFQKISGLRHRRNELSKNKSFQQPLGGENEKVGGDKWNDTSAANPKKKEKWRKDCAENDANKSVANARVSFKQSNSDGNKVPDSVVSDKPLEGDAKLKDSEPSGILSDQEMNLLASRALKAEILGNKELAKELHEKLKHARELRANMETQLKVEETVILTQTDCRGNSQPVSSKHSQNETKSKSSKFATHAEGKRMRYFADDDGHTLKDMFEKEKLQSSDSSNDQFLQLAAQECKNSNAKDFDDMHMDQTGDVFSGDRDVLEKAKGRHRKIEKVLDNCHYCMDSKKVDKHLIINGGNKSYIALPSYQSLTEGHCLIIPTYHTPCGTQVDEDVWEEIQDFKKKIARLFNDLAKDVVFFECALNLKKFPHMMMNCVPIAREMGLEAPIYFKKALLDCEKEWAHNKKVIDISWNNDVRKVIPKGLPYFAVTFGLNGGFAHVIEDERNFPRNFAEEVIGGMLDIDQSLWRKKRTDAFEVQCHKVKQFKKWWMMY